jgi:hypothetical protein
MFTYVANLILFDSNYLFFVIALSLSLLHVVLKGLKQNTFRGPSAFMAWECDHV